jgi:hypothetical protein
MLNFLRSIPIFQGVSDVDLRLLASAGEEVELAAGEHDAILRQNTSEHRQDRLFVPPCRRRG